MGLAHLLSYTAHLFLNTARAFFSFYEIFGWPNRVFQWNVIAILVLFSVLKVFDKFVDQTTIVFERKLFIIVNGNTDFILRLNDFLFTMKLFQEWMLQYLQHCETFLWVKLQGFWEQIITGVWYVRKPFVFRNFLYLW